MPSGANQSQKDKHLQQVHRRDGEQQSGGRGRPGAGLWAGSSWSAGRATVREEEKVLERAEVMMAAEQRKGIDVAALCA